MYELEYPWLLALLPLPILVWWLAPPYRQETASVRLAFFDEVARASGLTPSEGAVVPRRNLVQKFLAPLCWVLLVLALARPQLVEPPIQKVQPARDLYVNRDTAGVALDPSVAEEDVNQLERKTVLSSKVGVDATRKHAFPARSVPPREDLDRVDAQWADYGLE